MPALKKLLPMLALALAACQSATDVLPQLDVSLSLSTTSASQPAVVAVAVTVVNRSARVVQTPDPRSYACNPPYVVTDASGKTVVLPGRICTLIGYFPVELAPGASLVIHDRWALDEADGIRARQVDAGQYRVRGRVYGADQEQLSAPVTITVLP